MHEHIQKYMCSVPYTIAFSESILCDISLKIIFGVRRAYFFIEIFIKVFVVTLSGEKKTTFICDI